MRTAVGVAILLAAGSAAAQEKTNQKLAAAKFTEGKSHYDLAEYDPAIEAFKEAYRLDKQPLFLYNIAQAYRQKGECRLARTFYRTYLREDPEAYNKDRVDRRIEEMAECIRKAGGDPDAPDPVAETEIEPEPEPEPEPPPPPRTIIVTRPPTEPPDRTRLYAAGAAGGVALVLGAVGLYFTFKMNTLEDDLSLFCAEGCDWDDPFVRDFDHDAKSAMRNSYLLYSGAGIATLAAAALVTWHYMDSPRRVGVEPAPGGAVVTASTRF